MAGLFDYNDYGDEAVAVGDSTDAAGEWGQPDPGWGDGGFGAGDVAQASGGADGWIDTLKSTGGKVLDAYKAYTQFSAAKADVDTARANAQAAQERTRAQTRLQSDLLGFQGNAERTRAAQSALVAQQGYKLTAAAGSPLVLVGFGVLLYLWLKR